MSGAPPDPERWRRIQAVFHDVLAQPPDDRAAFLTRACGDDPALRAHVQKLIAADGAEDGLTTPNTALNAGLASAGQRVGPYALHHPIGAGGMGEVWLAERADGQFEQQVAIKLVRTGLDTAEILARFRRERQVLARLQHPNIARLLDGGATEAGRPYLVMEYIDGVPLDAACDATDLDARQRVALFRKVCAAVAAAHRQLVVHRDLKPGNILVDADGEPKLLDFGIAKVLSGDDEGAATMTAPDRRPLTVRYAAPEQIRGEPETTATDVYALGVVLYELLTGRSPYRLEGRPTSEVASAVCDEVPQRPSTAMYAGDAKPTRPRRALAGDLDTIILMALRKEPERRYGTVEQLSEDLDRYLRGRPVAARPDTVRYRTAKFVRRNRLLVSAVGAIFIVLVGAMVLVTRQAAIARDALASTEAVSRFMNGVFLSAQPREAGQDVTVRDALNDAAARVADELGDRPRVEGGVRSVLGTTYRTLGDYKAAVEQLEPAADALRRTLGLEHRETLWTMHELALAYRDVGRFDEARSTAAETLAGRRSALADDDGDITETITLLGLIALEQERFEDADRHLAEALTRNRRDRGDRHPETLVTLKYQATSLKYQERATDALSVFEEVLAGQLEVLGPDHMDTLITRNDLAGTLKKLERLDEAAAHFQAALDGMLRQLPPGHMDTLIVGANYADLLNTLERFDEADTRYAQLIEVGAPHFPADHWLLAMIRVRRAEVLIALDRIDEAATLAVDAREHLIATFGADNRFSIEATGRMALIRHRQGRLGESGVLLDTLPEADRRLWEEQTAPPKRPAE